MGCVVAISWLLAGYVTLGLLIIMGLHFYYDRRQAELCDRERSQAIFHCIRCGHIYTDRQEKEVSSCTQCSFENSRLKF